MGAMLDMKRTFDALVTRFAESDEARERILGNRIYRARVGCARRERRVLRDG
ncbi:MAG: hypothetical protein U5K74_16500 [Gemmatimonadaceae bacterium]|nr:hypothetical protein [Gemmatimonadaceae bacterium]